MVKNRDSTTYGHKLAKDNKDDRNERQQIHKNNTLNEQNKTKQNSGKINIKY